jgi:hypothetical protein
MAFAAQNALEEALLRAASDPAFRPKFYKELEKADLFIIQESLPGEVPGPRVLKAGEQLRIFPLEWNAKSYLPVFSSPLRIKAFAPQSDFAFMGINAMALLKMTRGAEMLLNPGSEIGKELKKEEIAAILDGSIWKTGESHTVEEDSQVLIGEPAQVPGELLGALERYFKNEKSVKRAYLAQILDPKRNEGAHKLLALECTGEWERIVSEAGMVAQNIAQKELVDVMQIDESNELSQYLVKNIKPFYTRKFLGLF